MVCYFCKSKEVLKNGKRSTGEQNYRCKNCNKQFIEDYFNKHTKSQKVNQELNNAQNNHLWMRWFGFLEETYI